MQSRTPIIDAVLAVRREGFALLPRFRPECATATITAELGCLAKLPGIDLIQVLTPKETGDATPNTYSGAFGTAAFPAHTDLAHWYLPPRYFVLRAISGTSVATHLLSGADIVAAVGRELLARGLVRPRRPKAGRMPLLQLYQRVRDNWLIRWDERYIQPASQVGTEASLALSAAISSAKVQAIRLDTRGDTLIVDNWRMLHGRAPVPPESRHRIVERCYMQELLE